MHVTCNAYASDCGAVTSLCWPCEPGCLHSRVHGKSASQQWPCVDPLGSGNADKAWVPTGHHYLDKQAHETHTAKRPPNSPQGNVSPSPASSCRHKSPRSPSRQGRTGANSPMRPPWDMWASPGKTVRSAQSSPCGSPTRAALKKMTANWSPGRKGFVKPELAEADENRFSHTHSSKAAASEQASKPRKKKSSPKKAQKEPASSVNEVGKMTNKGCGSSIWAGTLTGPESSFLQPILHSQSNFLPGDTHQDRQLQPDSQPKQSPAKQKKKKQRKHARAQRHQSQGGEDQSEAELDGGSQAQVSPPRVYTLDQSPRGSYVSPLRASPRRGQSSRHDTASAMMQSPQIAPRSMRHLNFPQLAGQCSDTHSAGPHSSHLSTQRSGADSGSSQLSAQLSEYDDDLSCSVNGATLCPEGSDCEEEEQSWAAGSTRAESGALTVCLQCSRLPFAAALPPDHGSFQKIMLSANRALTHS